MTKLLLRLPWFASAPLILVIAGAFAWLGYAFTGDYFNETCKNERNLLTNEFEPSNCGEGAKVAARLGTPGATTPGATVTPGASGTQRPAGTPGAPTPPAANSAAGVLAKGAFRDGDTAHSGAGQVEIQRLPSGKLNVFLSNFSVTNGPDLFVVLGKAAGGSYGKDDFTVAKLKANNGNQNYEIDGNPNLDEFRTVLIWCRRFNIVFAVAPLDRVRASALPGAPTLAAAGADSTAPANGTPTVAPATARPPQAAPTTPTPIGAQTTPVTTGGNMTPTPTDPSPSTPTAPGVLVRGNFQDGSPGHTGSGRAEIQRLAGGALNLFLGGFSVTNGPDLYVVLSTGDGGAYSGADLTLAKLTANNGSQNYAIPANIETRNYRSVLIWCKQFNIVFAFAALGGS